MLLSNLAIAQSFSYSYIDPCNGKTYKIDMPYGQNQIAVTYYGQVKSFTADDFNNGNFESWASGVFNQYQNASPCGGIGTAVTISQSQSTALTIVGIMNSLSALSDMANSGGSGNILAAAGSMDKAKESKKNKNNNSTSDGSTTNGTTNGNSTDGSGTNTSGTETSGGSTTNGNSTTTGGQNQTNGSSNTTGNSSTSGNNQSTTTNQGSSSNASGSGTTGGQNGTTTGTQNNTTTGNGQSSQPTVNGTSSSTTPNSGSSTSGGSTTSGESNTAGSTTNGGTTASGSSGGSTTSGSGTSGGSTTSGGSGTKVSGDGSNEKPSDGTTPDNTTPAGEKKSDAMGGTVNAVKAVNKNGGKPSILLSSDLVGFQFKNNEITTGTKINGGYTSMRYDGLRTHGVLVDYTSSIKGPNVTGFYAWIKPKAITLLSSTVTFGRVGSGSIYNTVAFGQMRTLPYKIKAVYMLTFSGGQIYKESYYGSAAIVGFNKDFKIKKRIEIKTMALFVYAPFVRYYQDEVLKSPYVILPIVGTNIGVTKKFKININLGGAYSMGDNVLNYTLMMGTRLAL